MPTAPHPAGVPASAQAVPELLKQQLPAGTVTSHYGDQPADPLMDPGYAEEGEMVA